MSETHETERTLVTEVLMVEQKTFTIALKENHRGRFIRITEQVANRRNTLILPITGLDSFIAKLSTLRSSS